MKDYFILSRRNTHNFILAMLLLGLYEFSKILFGTSLKVINGIDAWFQNILNLFPYKTYVISGIIFLVGLILFIKDYKNGIKISLRVMLLMLIEAFIWAVIIFMSLPALMSVLKTYIPMQVQVHSPNLFQKIVLSLGAGFYEEFFFRLILVYFLLIIFKILKRPESKIVQYIFIVIITALLFSAVHYIGPLGDEFSWYSFIYRAIFGMIMSFMILLRGFAITSWTHAFYDILVFTMQSMI